MQKICVSNGKVWEKAELHLKAAIQDFDSRNLAKRIGLDLLKELVR